MLHRLLPVIVAQALPFQNMAGAGLRQMKKTASNPNEIYQCGLNFIPDFLQHLIATSRARPKVTKRFEVVFEVRVSFLLQRIASHWCIRQFDYADTIGSDIHGRLQFDVANPHV
jgi:hypothetical protein